MIFFATLLNTIRLRVYRFYRLSNFVVASHPQTRLLATNSNRVRLEHAAFVLF